MSTLILALTLAALCLGLSGCSTSGNNQQNAEQCHRNIKLAVDDTDFILDLEDSPLDEYYR